MSGKGKSVSFTCTLNPCLRLDDRGWSFALPNLPAAQDCNQASLVKKIVFRTDAKERKHLLDFRLESIGLNRAIQADPMDQYVLVSLEDFKPLKQTEGVEPGGTGLQPATFKDCVDYAIRFLRAGVMLNGVAYHFYGHSNSQLKSRSCFLYAGSTEHISRKIEALGDFTTMKTVAKKAKRIGLLFSVARAVMMIPPDRYQDIPDLVSESPPYVFTDGCGLIAPSLAQELSRRIRIVYREKRYTPSVFQIQYRRYKGVVTVDPRMGNQPLLKLRKSMNKFSGGVDNSFAAVDHSKPYTTGFLNDEHIVLLEALGVTRETLLQKQNQHFQLLTSARTDSLQAFRFLSYVNEPDLAERLLVDGVECLRPQINKLVKVEVAKMLNKRGEQKCRIFVAQSRLLFGVCDAWDVLREGECHVKVTLETEGIPTTLKNTKVMVTRNPCLHPGDWQKFNVVDRPELTHLVDCIVFSTKGRRPAADLMSGGDLDGDQFFVCWDKDLIPARLSQPASYPGGRDPVRFGRITDDDRLVYFANYINASLGQVKTLFMKWARAKGPMSRECQELNRLFSHAPSFILDYLHDEAQKAIQTLNLNPVNKNSPDDCTLDMMDLLLAREDIAMSEFDFIHMTYRWCCRNMVPLETLLHYFDFNVLTSEEKIWLMKQLPVFSETPSLVMNALCSSNILGPDDLSDFGLENPRINWKCVYDTSRDRLATFLDAIAANMELFHRKLVIFRLDERLGLALYVPRRIKRARDVLVDDSIRLFAFPHSQGRERQSRLVVPTKHTYRLYCDGHILQLFQNKRANSWVFLTQPGSNDLQYRDTDDKGEMRRERQNTIDSGVNADVVASITLDKFSRDLQRHVGKYVISNRDVKSMHTLDLWLEYVETRETLPLFDQQPKAYSIPKPEEIVISAPEGVVKLVQHQNIAALGDLGSVDEYLLAFTSLLRLDSKSFLLSCFDQLLQDPSIIGDPRPVFHAMVSFLRKAPFLAISFGRQWHGSPPQDVLAVLGVSVAPILRAFILSAEQAGQFVLDPFRSTLKIIPSKSLSLDEFARLTELVSLTVRSPELAMDLLLECLEAESCRILSAPSELIGRSVRNLIAIAMDHIGEALESGKASEDIFELKFRSEDDDGYAIVEVPFRVDSPGGVPGNASHIRLTAATLPSNVIAGQKYSVAGLVTKSQQGSVTLRCFHPLPTYYTECSWKLENCGPFANTKAAFDAVRKLGTELEQCCGLAGPLLGMPSITPSLEHGLEHDWHPTDRLNKSQNAAVEAALSSPMICLWGPPGTGKTETIVEMICALQEEYVDARILVTAPTHNATDNVLCRYCRRLQERPLRKRAEPRPLRVSTDVRKVGDELRSYTVDAMIGQDLNDATYKAAIEAKHRVKNCPIVFTTCAGAGLGLLRKERFQVIIVDEASQQTEPASLVPLVKGCAKGILVGDHVQLRPTVQQCALPLEFDVSLFERLYTSPSGPCIRKLMLETQYRMHPSVGAFSSREFYQGQLKAGVQAAARPLFASQFPWPDAADKDLQRMVFVECAGRELLGGQSKGNKAQAKLCADILTLLTSPAPARSGDCPSPLQDYRTADPQSIAVLTPYNCQAGLLRPLVGQSPEVEISSIDGYQGREADIVVFVTVRSNERRRIGFLKDLRRMNVALTRARAGLIIIGNRATLTEDTSEPESAEMWKKLLDYTVSVTIEPS